MTDSIPNEEAEGIVLWDLPVRLSHWAFVILLPGLYFTYKTGNMDLHVLLGEVMLAVLLFRLLWGIFGSQTARFASFVKGPRTIIDYVRGTSGSNTIGHNPLGALSVVALLALLCVQVGLGLFSSDTDGLYSGPLDRFVSYETSLQASELHESVFNLILAMVALHLVAILFYRVVKRDNLIKPMITGRRVIEGASQPALASSLRFLACVAVSIALTYWIANGSRPL